MLPQPNHKQPALHVILVATGLLAATAALRPAGAQSFDCRQAHYRDEMLICEESALGRLDQQLATLYRQKIGRLPKERQDEFHQHETSFVIARRKCGDNYRCVEQSFRNRIQELENFASEDERERSSGADSAAERRSDNPTRSREHSKAPTEQHVEPNANTNETEPQPPQHASGSREGPAGRAMATPPEPSEPQRPKSASRSHDIAAPPPAPTRIEAMEALSSKRDEKPRKVARQPEHRAKPSHTTEAATPEASPPLTRPNAAATAASPSSAVPPATAKQSGSTNPPSTTSDGRAATGESSAKPAIRWVDPAPAR